MKDGAASTGAVGALVGAVSALPGASGSTMLVVFGLYERLICAISGIRRLASDIRFVAVLAAGILIGMFACSVCLDFIVDRWEMPAMFFFGALILCQIPDVKSMEGRSEPAGKSWWIAFAAGFLAMIALLPIREGGSIEPSAPVMILIGALFAIAKILPGVSGSTVLIALGLYDAFLEAISGLDFGYLLPMIAGAAAAVILLAKTIRICIGRYRTASFGAIMGLTVGSMVTVLASACAMASGAEDILPAAAGIASGLIAGYALRLLARKYRGMGRIDDSGDRDRRD